MFVGVKDIECVYLHAFTSNKQGVYMNLRLEDIECV